MTRFEKKSDPPLNIQQFNKIGLQVANLATFECLVVKSGGAIHDCFVKEK